LITQSLSSVLDGTSLISPKTLLNWVRRAKTGDLPEAGTGAPRHMVTEQEAELSRLRRENAELRMERDILKKCMAPPSGSSAVRTM
jgi:transposase